jgi:exonuclease III
MAKLFSVASWNVEHFRSQNTPSRKRDVVDFLGEQDPDVFALYEVEGKEIFAELTQMMPAYTFHITEGRNTQEILVGVRHGLTAFFTQRTEFQSRDSLLRPGALLTLTFGEDNYSMLFLHTKSGNTPHGLGLRDDMLQRALDFTKPLDRKAGPGKRAKYIFLGDFNIMGMEYRFVRERDILAELELLKLERTAPKRQMKVLEKDRPNTWWGGGSLPESNLDFVVARREIRFAQFAGGANVSVRGWPQEPTPQKRLKWVRTMSDHALLYFEVHD